LQRCVHQGVINRDEPNHIDMLRQRINCFSKIYRMQRFDKHDFCLDFNIP